MFVLLLSMFKVILGFNLVLNPLGSGDSYFLSTNLTIGSNNQSINFIGIDTGSAITWFLGKDCVNNGRICPGSIFDSSTSKSYKSLSESFVAKYDDKTKFSGLYSSDNIHFGEKDIELTFGLVSKANYNPSDSLYNQALLGMSLSCCGDYPTVMDTWFPGVSRIFSIYLPDQLTDNGIISFGDPVKEHNLVASVSIDLGDEDWSVSSIFIEDSSGNPLSGKYSGYLDTGSDMIYIPKKELKNICAKIGWNFNKEGCTSDCSKVKALNNFVVNLGGSKLEISISDHFTYETESNTCSLAFIPTSKNQGITLGMAFLRQFITEWDISGKKVSFFRK